MDLKKKLREVKDFPKKGINFIDITTVLQDKEALRYCINEMTENTKEFGDFDIIVGPESRGFIFGMPIAYNLNKGFVPVRKKGKLPHDVISAKYELEYGVDVLEIHRDAIKPGQKVVIIDDLLATGGTTLINIELIERLGGEIVGIIYFIELEFLNAINKLKGYSVKSLVKYK